jgi:hypothetical protein
LPTKLIMIFKFFSIWGIFFTIAVVISNSLSFAYKFFILFCIFKEIWSMLGAIFQTARNLITIINFWIFKCKSVSPWKHCCYNYEDKNHYNRNLNWNFNFVRKHLLICDLKMFPCNVRWFLCFVNFIFFENVL